MNRDLLCIVISYAVVLSISLWRLTKSLMKVMCNYCHPAFVAPFLPAFSIISNFCQQCLLAACSVSPGCLVDETSQSTDRLQRRKCERDSRSTALHRTSIDCCFFCDFVVPLLPGLATFDCQQHSGEPAKFGDSQDVEMTCS